MMRGGCGLIALTALLTVAAPGCSKESDRSTQKSSDSAAGVAGSLETVETLAGAGGASAVLRAGMVAPPLGLEALLQAPSGTTASWEALRGKAVVLEFWATWCGPCVAAIPHLNELAEKYADKPIQFIAVTNEREESVTRFLRKKPIRAWIGLDTDQSMHRAYNVHGVPMTVLVNPQGVIAGITYPTQLTAAVLDDLLAGRPLAGMEVQEAGRAIVAGIEPDAGPQAEPPLFQVLIRPTRTDTGGSTVSGQGNLTMNGVRLDSILTRTYQCMRHEMDIGFELPEEQYDVVIRLPPGHAAETGELLRKAVELTFGLTTRRETRTVDAYSLVLAEDSAVRPTPSAMDEQGGSGAMSGTGMMEVTNATAGTIAANLAGHLERPVFDETGLTGRYDVSLRWEDESPETFIAAVRQQLGLELRPTQRPVEILVVERHPAD
jgi:uncharacterized protein (TIGR03435 family)